MVSIQRPVSRQPIPTESKTVFEGALFDVVQWKQRLFNGKTVTFEKVKRPDTAYVIPVWPDGSLTLISQMQPGSVPVNGLVGGRIETNERPEDSARRELLEEAGIEAGKIELLGSFQILPKIDWAVYIFCCEGLSVTAVAKIGWWGKISLISTDFDGLIRLAARDDFGDSEVALFLLRLAFDEQRFSRAKELFDLS